MRKVCVIAIALFIAMAIAAPGVNAYKFDHIRTAALTYSMSDEIGCDFVGRHYDLAINPTSNNLQIIKNADPNTKCLHYMTESTFRSTDYDDLTQWCQDNGVPFECMVLWTNNSISLNPIAPVGECIGNVYHMGENEIVKFCGWNMERLTPDFSEPNVWNYLIHKYRGSIGSEYDGVMVDEPAFYHHPTWGFPGTGMAFPFPTSAWANGAPSDIVGYSGQTREEIKNELLAHKRNDWMPMLLDSLEAWGKLRFCNPAGYYTEGCDIEDDIFAGSGGLLGEGAALSPLGNYFYNMEYLEHMENISETPGYAIIWTTIYASESLSLGSWARCQMERLSWYYMAANTEQFAFLLTGNESWLHANDFRAADSLYKWSPAFEFDIGQPIDAKYLAHTGTDPAGQSYQIYRRDYTNGIVYWRRAIGSTYNNSSAVTINLDEPYMRLRSDGTLSDSITSFSIRNCEGVILTRDGEPTPGAKYRKVLAYDLGFNEDSTQLIFTVDFDSNMSGFVREFYIDYVYDRFGRAHGGFLGMMMPDSCFFEIELLDQRDKD